MDYKNLQKQLDEIQNEGVMNIGYAYAIFKDENFDLNYAIGEIIPDLIGRGLLDRDTNGGHVQDIMLDEYLSDLEVEEFYYLAKYFFNYKRHNKEEE